MQYAAQLERQKQTQFTPTLSTPETLQTRKAVPPSWTVVLCAISCRRKKKRRGERERRGRERENTGQKVKSSFFMCSL